MYFCYALQCFPLVSILHCIIIYHVCIIAGFERPSAIQQRAIRPMEKGRYVIAQFV